MYMSVETLHHFSLHCVFTVSIVLTLIESPTGRWVLSGLSVTSVSVVPPCFLLLSADQSFIYTTTLWEAKLL